MPTATPTIEITEVPAGKWAIVVAVKVNGVVPPDPVNRVWAELTDHAYNMVKETTPANSDGKVIWDGNIEGTWTDILKKTYIIHAHFLGDDSIIYTKTKYLYLGYYNWEESYPTGLARAQAVSATVASALPVVGSLVLGLGAILLARK